MMGNANRTTFNKLQKERTRQQKARDKAERKRSRDEGKEPAAQDSDIDWGASTTLPGSNNFGTEADSTKQ
jgi:hypothetical protein